MTAEDIQTCVDAFAKAVETIKVWHGEIAWDTYNQHSPEMRQIHDAVWLLKRERNSVLIRDLKLP